MRERPTHQTLPQNAVQLRKQPACPGVAGSIEGMPHVKRNEEGDGRHPAKGVMPMKRWLACLGFIAIALGTGTALAETTRITNLDTGEVVDPIQFQFDWSDDPDVHDGQRFRFEGVALGSGHLDGAHFYIRVDGRVIGSVSAVAPSNAGAHEVRRWVFEHCGTWDETDECRTNVEGRFTNSYLEDARFPNIEARRSGRSPMN